MKQRKLSIFLVLFSLILSLLQPPEAVAREGNGEITSPETFFGFQMGADRKLARWDKLVEYYDLLAMQSPRIKVVNMGKSTLGNPFLALYISSPENLARLEELREINARLSDPRGVPKTAIDRAIEQGRAVVVQTMGLHSSEVAASQMTAELVYDMLERDDEDMLRILDNTIAIMIPCLNPDGEIMVTDWYNKTLGTEYEGVGLPSLYHHYIGHDNNRDAFMQNTIESYYGAKILFRDWVPQAYIDHHQMGPYSARLYVPPYSNPFRPNADPLVWREMSWYGAHIAYKEEEAGVSGVVNAAIYSGWGHFGFHWITPFHNIAGMLTESASARLATPLYVHPDQLKGGRRALPEYEAQTTFPNPWPGGWWRVRDIVEQQKIAAIAALDIAARNRTTVLKNAYLKAKRQTERGANGKTVAYIVPAAQHDPLTAGKMVKVLLGQGVEVKIASQDFTHEGRVYDAGSWVIPMAQPKQGVIRWLLGRTFYPDNSYTRNRDDQPIRPYDMSTDNIAEYMGVHVEAVGTEVDVPMKLISEIYHEAGSAESNEDGYVLDARLNDSFKAVNMLWNAKIELERVVEPSAGLHSGDFVIRGSIPGTLIEEVRRQTGVEFKPLPTGVSPALADMHRLRIGMYQRYLGGNIDEGWTRLLLENFDFPYTTIMDEELKDGRLNRKYDVIILPNDSIYKMTGLADNDEHDFDYNRPEAFPPEYRSGFGEKGVEALQVFVKDGGTLLALGDAGELPVKKFKLPIRNVVADVPTTEFWSPGSTLRMNIDNQNPLAYGMPEEAVGLFLSGNDVYEVIPSEINHRIKRVATYVERDILQSGWLLGEKYIANKAAMVSVGHGKGTVILIGFRPQHRVQTHGTFKLVFNALIGQSTSGN